MSVRTFFYALWCMGVVLLFMLSSYRAWSPFAEGGRSRAPSGVYGPNHK
jgi:hypothetical protein